MDNNVVGQQPQSVQVPNYSGVNIQIFNPSVAAPGAALPASNVNATTYSSNPQCCYPPNYYTQNLAQNEQPQAQPVKVASPTPVQPVATDENKVAASAPTTKKEKKEVVTLTDDYIKTLESYLNDQNKEKRLMAAKEVLARLEEDNSRKNDPALNALVNKMLQDPYQPVRFIAMAALESRSITGNNKSLMLLSNIKNDQSNHGLDALKASNILLRMSGPTTTRVVEVPVNKDNKKVS